MRLNVMGQSVVYFVVIDNFNYSYHYNFNLSSINNKNNKIMASWVQSSTKHK